jgi:hypothetical protein
VETTGLEFIQAIISRLAGNSFLLKGWAVTLAAALLGFAAQSRRPLLGAVALLPALAFWGLDAYYLRHERIFRALYERSAARPAASRSLSLRTDAVCGAVASWPRTLLAPAVAGIHGVVVASVLAVTLGLWLGG